VAWHQRRISGWRLIKQKCSVMAMEASAAGKSQNYEIVAALAAGRLLAKAAMAAIS